MEGAEIGIITMGSADQAVAEARYNMAQEGIKTNCLRVRALPFTQEVVDFVNMHSHNYVVEVNRDGQLKQLLTLELPERCARLVSIAHINGLPLSARWVKNQIMAYEEKYNG